MKVYGIIYKATGPDGRVYIGQTVKTLKQRRSSHAYRMKKGDGRTPFQAALLALGFSSYTWEQIDQADTQEELDAKEKHYIAHYQSDNPAYGYNNTDGGKKTVFSQETRRKISASLKNSEAFQQARHSDEWREKHSKAMKGRKLSEEQCRKMSEQRKGKPIAPEHRQKLIESKKGKPVTPETRRKISETLKQYYALPENKQRQSEVHKGHSPTLATRRKIGGALKGRSYDPEIIKKRVATRKAKGGYRVTNEHRQKISIAKRGKSGNEKITEIIARQIKADIKAGMRNCDIQKKYDVSRYIVESIKYGTSWAWVEIA